MALGVLLAATGCGAGEDLRAKPATYVEVLPKGSEPRRLPNPFHVELGKDRDKALLYGPHFGIRVGEVAKTEEISADDARKLAVPTPFRAAAGHELLLVELSGDDTLAKGRWKTEKASPKAAIVVDGRRTELKAVPEPGSVLIASVRKGRSWARRGRAYLLLNLREVSSDGLDAAPSDPAIGFFVDPHRTFRLSMTGLGEARPFRGLAFNTVRLMARYLAVFEVPSSFRTGTLTIRPDGPLFAFRGTTSLAQYQNLARVPDCGGRVACLRWQRRPPAQEAPIRLTPG